MITRSPSSTLLSLAVVAALGAAHPGALSAQDEEEGGVIVSWSIDAANNFIWRGLEQGDGFAIQPGITFGLGNFEAGFWTTLSFSGNEYQELDFFASWSTEGRLGSLTTTFNHFYYVSQGGGFFDFWQDSDPELGAPRTFELYGEWTPPVGPLTLMAAWNMAYDPDRTLWAGAQLDRSFGDFDAMAQLGMVVTDSPFYYEAEAGDLYNLELGLTRNFTVGGRDRYVRAGFQRNLVFEENYWSIMVGF